MESLADDVHALLADLGALPAVLGGLSMGGYVALALWRRHADRVGALVLSDTRAGADDDAGRARRREMAALARTSGSAAVTEAMIPGMLGKSTRTRMPDVERQLRMMGEAADREGLAAALEAMMARPDSTPTLETIDVPTLVIVGDEDALTPPKQAEVLVDGIRGARLEIIAGAGHVPCLERPAAFNLVLGEFVAQLATA
jgi:pimeloyl-ACP methyl ester carboxylesterase